MKCRPGMFGSGGRVPWIARAWRARAIPPSPGFAFDPLEHPLMSPARDHLKAVRVSVVVPVPNGAELLRECLSALQASARPDTEIIVVDDGSTDGSGYVAGRMAVRVLRLGKNLGPAAARNRGALPVSSLRVNENLKKNSKRESRKPDGRLRL